MRTSGKHARELIKEKLETDTHLRRWVLQYEATFPHTTPYQRGQFREMLAQVFREGMVEGSRDAVDSYKEHLRSRRALAKQAARHDVGETLSGEKGLV